MFGPNWFGPEPFFGIDVKELKPGGQVNFDDSATGLKPISEIRDGEYNLQAILDHDFYHAEASAGAGNFFSKPVKVAFKGGAPTAPVELKLDQVIKAKTYKDTELMKFVEIESKLLSDFHKRMVKERAMVVLPPSYASQPERRFPVYVDITGFGGTLSRLQQRHANGQKGLSKDDAEFIHVYLTGQCKWGHHVYANSATNGPRGDMLINELIPAIDEQFRTIAKPTARFVVAIQVADGVRSGFKLRILIFLVASGVQPLIQLTFVIGKARTSTKRMRMSIATPKAISARWPDVVNASWRTMKTSPKWMMCLGEVGKFEASRLCFPRSTRTKFPRNAGTAKRESSVPTLLIIGNSTTSV